jgi:hypothetical protein
MYCLYCLSCRYTFIFSNEDMAPGSVRMFGPARLMVIAAQSLQQKLVDELSAVEAATTGGSDSKGQGTEAAVAGVAPAGLMPAAAAAAAPEGDTAEAIERQADMMSKGVSAVEPSPAVIGAPVGGTAAAAAAAEVPSFDPHPPGPLVSPFAARSGKGFNSFSAGPSAATSASASAAGSAATPVPAAAAGTDASAAANAATPAVIAAAAAAAVTVSPRDIGASEHSFTAADLCVLPNTAGAAGSEGTSAAAAARDDKQSVNRTSFAGFTPQQHGGTVSTAATAAGSSDAGGWQQQQQQRDSASVSDAGLSSSTIAGSTVAVAGSAVGSTAGFGPSSTDTSRKGTYSATFGSAPGQRVAVGDANSASRSVQWVTLDDSCHEQQQQQEAVCFQQQQQQQQGWYRPVQTGSTAMNSMQGSRAGMGDARGSEDQQQQQQAKFSWGRMDSLKRFGSKRWGSEVLLTVKVT